jgi:hypothetical protein
VRLVLVSLVLLLLLALGALEILAARGVSDADVAGGATVRIPPLP